MKPLVVIGLIVLILGVAALGYQGVAWVTTRDTVAKVGPVEVQADRQHAIPLWPILGGVGIVGGAVLMLIGANRRSSV
jgi:hypothetical protein